MNLAAWLIFVIAAMLEVGGDAVVRRGLRGRSVAWILLGCAALAGYGLVVNSVKWDFSKLLGVYVGFFALVSILFGKCVLRETIPYSTWLGLALILLGGIVIQFGRHSAVQATPVDGVALCPPWLKPLVSHLWLYSRFSQIKQKPLDGTCNRSQLPAGSSAASVDGSRFRFSSGARNSAPLSVSVWL